MDITEKEMNRNAVKNAVKTDITDEERLADLFGDCITATAWRGNFQRTARVLRRVIGK